LLAIGWLAVWGVGPAASTILLLHLTVEHPDDDHVAQELAAAATHGHRHDVGVASHGHPADREAARPTGTDLTPSMPAEMASVGVPPSLDVDFGPAPRATESPPLYRLNCALLL
jgi:hypothetical protein